MATPNQVDHLNKVEETPSEASKRSRGETPCGYRAKPCRSKFLVRLRSQEMGRASIGASLLSGAEWLKKKYKLNNKIKAVSEWETLHRFVSIP